MHLHSPSFAPAPLHHPVLAEDGEVLRRAALDDAAAFEALFHRHRDGLQGFLYRKLRSQEDAEDATVLTFCNAWRARSTYRGGSSGKAWLYPLATRVALDVLRSRRRHPADQELDAREPDLISAIDEEVVDPVELALNQEQTLITERVVGQAMDRLPADERQLIHMFYFDGYNYEQISEFLGVSRSQVRGRLHRIRGRVRRDMVHRQCWQPA